MYVHNIDIGSNNSGFYELLAVLTHRGRSSSSGHYLGWVKHHVSGINLVCFCCVYMYYGIGMLHVCTCKHLLYRSLG